MAGDRTRGSIAKEAGCTEKTLRSWIKAGDWEAQREAQSITRKELLQDSYKQLKAINDKIVKDHDGVPTKSLSDSKAVIMKEIDSLANRPLYVVLDVMGDFTAWLTKEHPERVVDITHLTNEYVELQAQEEGI